MGAAQDCTGSGSSAGSDSYRPEAVIGLRSQVHFSGRLNTATHMWDPQPCAEEGASTAHKCPNAQVQQELKFAG